DRPHPSILPARVAASGRFARLARFARRVAGAGARRGAAEDVRLQAFDELVEQLGAHVGEHAAPELGHLAGDGQVGDDVDTGAVAIGRERRGDGRARVALASGVAALGLQHGAVLVGVLLDERCLALVLRGDRADLDLHDPAVLVTFDLLKLRARHAGRDPLDVREHVPGGRRGDGHAEVVGQLHRSRSSRVSMSIGSPGHGTSATRSGRSRNSARAPSSPVAGSSGHTSAASRTGGRRWPANTAVAIGRSRDAATDRHASTGTSGWSASPTTIASWPAARAVATAACSDDAWPLAQLGLRTARAPAGTAMSTAPTTTSVSSSPAASAVSIAHDASGRPRNGASSLWSVPSKRAPAPAASTTAATVTSVDRPGGLAQQHRPAGPARAKGDDLGADRDRRLLRRAGTD